MIKFTSLLIASLSFLNCFSQTELEISISNQSDCDAEASICNLQPRIISQVLNNDVLTLNIGTVENCAGIHEPRCTLNCDTLFITYEKGRIEPADTIISGDTMIIEQKIPIGECDCCFEFEFTINKIYTEPKYIKINGVQFHKYPEKYKIYPVRFEILDSDTINMVDKYGRQQGKWNKILCDTLECTTRYMQQIRNYHFRKFVNEKHEFSGIYLNGLLQTAICKVYYQNGKLRMIIRITDGNTRVLELYDENGKFLKRDEFKYY